MQLEYGAELFETALPFKPSYSRGHGSVVWNSTIENIVELLSGSQCQRLEGPTMSLFAPARVRPLVLPR